MRTGAASFKRVLGSSILGLKIEYEQRRADRIVRVFREITRRDGARPFGKGRGLLGADAMAFPIIDRKWLNPAPIHLTARDAHFRTSQTP